MKCLFASIERGHSPTLTNAESDQRSTRLTVWTRVMHRPQQRAQSSTPSVTCRPDSRRIELQPLLRSH
jgi:hypothetical protein